MMRALWGWIVKPFRHNREFASRMRGVRYAALEQSRISLREQRRLRTSAIADDVFDGSPDPAWEDR